MSNYALVKGYGVENLPYPFLRTPTS